MEDFIKAGRKGTVLMSLGTNVKSNMLGEGRLKAILQAFAEIPDYNFLWKFESEIGELPLKPTSNVMIGKFLPQNDILAHPNLKAFISHAGILSSQEALWHGKPIIAIPMFVDQQRNTARSIDLGMAVKVDFRDLEAVSFKAKIRTVLDDPKYFESAQKVSKLFQDKPQRPLELAIWWVEYVIRNPNLDHLKSPTLRLGFFRAKSYDVILLLIIALHAVVFAIIKVIKVVKRLTKCKAKVE